MQRDRLLFGLAAVLAGIATLEFVLAFVYTPVLLAIAVPFAAAAYFVWYQASGRLRDRVESGRAGAYRRVGVGPGIGSESRADSRDDREMGGFGAGPRESYSNRRGGFDDRGEVGAGSRFGPGGGRFGQDSGAGRGRGGTRASGSRGFQQNAGPTPAEAYRVLGLDADATDEEVKRAYRERVKSVHPDREGGDEDEFKRVTEAYEVLTERT